MMHIYYLKTKDKQELYEALEAAGLATREYDPDDPLNQRPEGGEEVPDNWEPSGEYEWRFTGPGSLDVIGTIYKDTGETETTEEGVEVPVMAAIDGFHANLKLRGKERLTSLPELSTEPETPYRKFAGD